MKLVKLENEELSSALTQGEAYIQVGKRKFMLFEIEEVAQSAFYDVTDPEEEQLILEAVNGNNPSLSKEEVLEQLARHKKR
ncbi:hypothetical protein [Paenibacillus antarcticus]|uniref:Uncharacterized protein n=1 Tax=Paenibacillus antarcticus TaxID=253703 RepID=A0A162QF46_9BACL|nr:hypothetical protein [Paenibacillus antarcticus]OAB48000.1 hypothetical protein PBAT_03750 [Paenibacillus antarcticus]